MRVSPTNPASSRAKARARLDSRDVSFASPHPNLGKSSHGQTSPGAVFPPPKHRFPLNFVVRFRRIFAKLWDLPTPLLLDRIRFFSSMW